MLTLTAGAQLPLLLVLTALGGPLLRLFGDEYRHAYPLYVVLCVANALGSVGYVGSTLLLISGEVRRLCLLSVAACTVSVVGGYVLATGGLIWIGAALLAGEMVLAIGYAGTIRGALRTAGEPSRARVR